jgi:hypothetical protein
LVEDFSTVRVVWFGRAGFFGGGRRWRAAEICAADRLRVSGSLAGVGYGAAVQASEIII